jgi:hypothetical protein
VAARTALQAADAEQEMPTAALAIELVAADTHTTAGYMQEPWQQEADSAYTAPGTSQHRSSTHEAAGLPQARPTPLSQWQAGIAALATTMSTNRSPVS